MSSHREAIVNDKPYVDPNPLPSSVPHVEELGVTSAPLKSASFFIGEYCKEVNGECPSWCLSSDNVHGSLCAMRRTSARTFPSTDRGCVDVGPSSKFGAGELANTPGSVWT